MGNTFTCVEEHHWDSHAEISAPYPGWADKVDDGAAAGVHQDMTLPLSSYFISSGHNSYLTGDQLLAKSGIETIVRVSSAHLNNTSGYTCNRGMVSTPHLVG